MAIILLYVPELHAPPRVCHRVPLAIVQPSHRWGHLQQDSCINHGCRMAIARSLDPMCLALRASGLRLRYATLQKLIPAFPWIAPPCPPLWRNPWKGRDQILPSGNTQFYLLLRDAHGDGDPDAAPDIQGDLQPVRRGAVPGCQKQSPPWFGCPEPIMWPNNI